MNSRPKQQYPGKRETSGRVPKPPKDDPPPDDKLTQETEQEQDEDLDNS